MNFFSFPISLESCFLVSASLPVRYKRGVGRSVFIHVGIYTADREDLHLEWTCVHDRSHTRPCLHDGGLTRDPFLPMAAAMGHSGGFNPAHLRRKVSSAQNNES